MPPKKGMLRTLEGVEGIERIEKWLEWCTELYQDPERRDWSANILPHLSIVSHNAAMPHPRVTFRMVVQPIHVSILDFCPLAFWFHSGHARVHFQHRKTSGGVLTCDGFLRVAQDNGSGNMHGGCTSTIFDMCTTMPLHFVCRPGFWQFLGVSRTLNCTFLRPIPVGATVDVECDILQVGNKLCTVRGIMRAVDSDGSPGPVLAVCEHGKVSTDPPAEKL